MRSTKIILFTATYPYGIGEMWKQNEIKLLSVKFKEIHVIPLNNGGNNNAKDLKISNVQFKKPLFNSTKQTLNYFDLFSSFIGRTALSNLKELIHILPRFNKYNFIKLLNSAKRIREILKKDIIKEIICSDNSDTILYFYWGLGTAEIIPFIDTSKFKKVVVRMHRYDLYEYENDNYIPFRKQLLNKKILVLPCSDDGANHLVLNYANCNAIIKTQRLGVLNPKKVSTGSLDGTIRIVSCSSLVKVKRIEKMIAAAAQLEIPFKWIHIGGGELYKNLEMEILRLNQEGNFSLVGEINSELVTDFLVKGNFDLFVNTSRSEGVPVSIMEAFSVGIPVIAADAGGTKEIVDSSVGCLLRNDFAPIELKNAIEKYFYSTKEEKNNIRQNAFSRFKEKCDIEQLNQEFIEILKK